MELALLIWFANIADSLSTFLGVIGTIMISAIIVLGLIAFLCAGVEGDTPEYFEYKKTGVFILLSGLLLCLVSNLIPNERTVYLMTAGYIGQQVVTSEKFQKSTNDMYEIVNLKLEQIKKDMKEEIVKENQQSK